MNYAWLPPLYREIAERAGLEPTLGLARALGGKRIYVPLHTRIAPWLVQAMGEDGAEALVKMFGGEAIELPTDPTAGQKARVRRIHEMLDQGESANTVASAVGSSRRHIFWHKARMRERDHDREPDLFTPPKGR